MVFKNSRPKSQGKVARKKNKNNNKSKGGPSVNGSINRSIKPNHMGDLDRNLIDGNSSIASQMQNMDVPSE